MNRFFRNLLLLALFGVTLFVAPQLVGEQGYILIALGNWTLEGSIVSVVVASIIILAVVYILWRSVKYMLIMVVLPSSWWRKRSDKIHANYFQAGIDFMALKQWHLAAEQFLKVKRLDRIPLAQQMALVCASQAKDEKLSSDLNKRFNLPDKLKQQNNALSISEINSLISDDETELSSQQMDNLLPNFKKQTLPLQLMWLQQQITNHNWHNVNKHLVKVEAKVVKELDTKAAEQWQQELQTTLNNAFADYIASHSVNQLQSVYHGWSKTLQHNKSVMSAFVNALAINKQPLAIEKILINNIKDVSWLLSQIRHCYLTMGKTPFDDLFSGIQKKLSKSPKDKQLLTVYGYLAAGQKDHELAKQVLEQVIYSNQNNVDTKLYADELAALGEVRHSVEVYQSLYQLS